MPQPRELLLGEFRRTLDERYRLAIPDEFRGLLDLGDECVLAKERVGCISLWNPDVWQAKVNIRIDSAKRKVKDGLSDENIGHVQLLGRLLSTRHETVPVRDAARVVIPKGFRDFLGVRPDEAVADDASGKKGGAVMVVGAAVCIEIWNPAAWLQYLKGRMPKFRRLIEELS